MAWSQHTNGCNCTILFTFLLDIANLPVHNPIHLKLRKELIRTMKEDVNKAINGEIISQSNIYWILSVQNAKNRSENLQLGEARDFE